MKLKTKIFYACCSALCAVWGLSAQQKIQQASIKDRGLVISLKNTDRNTIVDTDVLYQCKIEMGEIVRYSFLRMKNEEKKTTENTTKLNVVNKNNPQKSQDTLLLGYGKPKVADKTVAAAAQVAGKDIARTPNANLLDALQGRVAGLLITTPSGHPEAQSSAQVHGRNSFSTAGLSEPLYIMDGVPVDSSIITMLNPADIERIAVLKEAAATTIYGARAANGVILITTQHGQRNQRPTISINQQVGFSSITSATRNFFDNLATPQEYINYWLKKNPNEVIQAGKLIDGVADDAAASAAKILRKYPYHTRWDKLFYRNAVSFSRTDVSVAGGSRNASYYLSFGHLNQEGTLKNTDYQRYNLSLNLEVQATQWLKGGLSTSLVHTDAQQRVAKKGAEADILSLPFYSPVDENGNRKDYIPSVLGQEKGFYHPDYWAEKYPSNELTDQVLPIGYLIIEPIENLSFKTQAGIQYNVTEGLAKTLPSFVDYHLGNPTVGAVSRSQSKAIQTTYTNLLEYDFGIGSLHNFSVLLGQESTQAVNKFYQAQSQGQPTDDLSMLTHGNLNLAVADNKSVITFNSYFSRIAYHYKNRYFLELSGRRDGSSSFGKNNRYANFWAVGAMWKLKEEAFLQNAKWLNELNLRLSTGLSGNANGGNYPNRTLFTANQYYKGRNGFFTSSLGNPDITWEEQQKTSIGLNAVLWNNTSLELVCYDSQVYRMLSTRGTNSMSGYTTFPDNVGEMQNRGVDLTLSAKVYRSQTKGVSVTPYVNLNYNQEKVLALSYGKQYNITGDVGYRVGEPIEWALPVFKGFNTDGNPEWYLAGEEEKTTTDFNSATLAQLTGKKLTPPLNGGFGCNITYRDFDFELNFSYSSGKYLLNEDKFNTYNPQFFGGHNFNRELLNQSPLAHRDSRLLEDASFVRLKSLMLGYTMPQYILDQLKFFKALRLYASARNVFTLTQYSGADPEMAVGISAGGYPPSKQITLGVELKF